MRKMIYTNSYLSTVRINYYEQVKWWVSIPQNSSGVNFYKIQQTSVGQHSEIQNFSTKNIKNNCTLKIET